MANICTGQNQMHIILTRIGRAFNEVFKKDKKCLGTSIFFLWCCTVYIELYDLWPFHEHPLKHKSRFSEHCNGIAEVMGSNPVQA